MNVQEILNISKERKLKLNNSIEQIIENVHKKIKYYATMKKESCVYMIPPIINDTPLYDIVFIVKEVFKTLDTEGYIVTAYPNGKLEINWNEALVKQKIDTDSYLFSKKSVKNITHKSKNIDQKFSFLANPEKTCKTVDDLLDSQLKKILKQKDSQQKKLKNVYFKGV